LKGESLLTYPRFARACYAFFAVAVLVAVLKLSISGGQPILLKMLPATPTANAVEPAAIPLQAPGDPRLRSFSDGGVERLEPTFSRSASRERLLEGSDKGSDGPSGGAPVFRRPSLDRGSTPEPVCGDLGDVPASSRVVFPLPEAYFNSYDDTWGAARPQGGHEGSDLMSPAGTPEFALTDGRLVAVAASNENGWNRLGGYTVMLEAAYDVGPIKKGDLFYYAHLDRESSLPVGTEVRAGQKIGTVGDTGEGPEVTRGKFPPHLHLGWYDADLSEGRSEAKSGAMNPYPLLLWLERNGGAVSGGTDASYCQAPQSPNPTPSTGESDWPTPSASGQRPDLDTGSDQNMSPSPAVKDDEPRGNRPEGAGDETRSNSKNRGEDKDHEAKDKGEGREAEEFEKAHKKAIKLQLRKKMETKMATLLRDLSGLDFDRVPSRDGDEREQEKKRGDGRKDGEAGKERGERQQETERTAENRSEGNQIAPPQKPPAPPKPSPDRGSRPAPEGTGENSEGVEKPEARRPPEVGSKSSATEPVPPPDSATSEPAVDDAASGDATVPISNGPPPAANKENESVIEPGGE